MVLTAMVLTPITVVGVTGKERVFRKDMFDGLVKSQKTSFFVIPAKAGI